MLSRMAPLRRLVMAMGLIFAMAVSAVAQQIGGVGVGYRLEDGYPVVAQVLAGSPAGRSGALEAGDRIVAIASGDGAAVSTLGLSSAQIGQLIQGPVGSEVRLSVVSASEALGAGREVTLVRERMNPSSPWGAGVPAGSNPSWVEPQFLPMRVLGSYLVILPPDYESSDAAYPICVLLHGSGSSEQSFGPIATQLGREGIIYVAVRAPYVSIDATIELRRPGFTAWPPDEVSEDSPLYSVPRVDYVDWIFDVVDAVRAQYRVRPGRVSLFGFSQGGGIAASAAALYPDRVRSLYSQSGSTPPDSFLTEERLAAIRDAGVAVWMVHGSEDTVVPLQDATALAERLTGAGVPVDFRVVPGGHEITSEMFGFAAEWLQGQVRGD